MAPHDWQLEYGHGTLLTHFMGEAIPLGSSPGGIFGGGAGGSFGGGSSGGGAGGHL